MSEDPKLYGVIANAVASWRATEKIKFSAPQSKLLCDHLYKKIADKQDNVGIAEALGNFAQKTSRQTALHWYMGFDSNGKVAMFPEEIGLPMFEATKTTVKTIREQIAKELEPIIDIRSQGIWYDIRDKKKDKMNETTMTGCSVVPTRELIKLWEKLTRRKWQDEGNDLLNTDQEAKNG